MMYMWMLGLALIGLVLSFYIFFKKRRSERLICFIGQDCDVVIHSKYSKLLFGIPNEVLGILYYTFDAVLMGLFLNGITSLSGFSIASVLFTVSGIAAFFSLILTAIQVFVLKELCEYCLASAGISIVIFILIIL